MGAVTRLPWAPLVLLINLSDGQKEHKYLGGWTSGLTHGFGRIWGSTVAFAITSAC